MGTRLFIDQQWHVDEFAETSFHFNIPMLKGILLRLFFSSLNDRCKEIEVRRSNVIMWSKPPTIHHHWTTSETHAIVVSELFLSAVIDASGEFEIASFREWINRVILIRLEQPWRQPETTFSFLAEDQEIRFPVLAQPDERALPMFDGCHCLRWGNEDGWHDQSW